MVTALKSKKQVNTSAGKRTVKKGKKNVAESYNRYKFFEGKQYTGMQVGRSLVWNYDKGRWKDVKITPERWEIAYQVTKRRAGQAPEGSGAAVGTGYHWFICAHQYVEKLNADDYSTSMVGQKFKLAHKRASTGKWTASDAAQRKRLIEFLKSLIAQMEDDPKKIVPLSLDFEYRSQAYSGIAVPVLSACIDGECHILDITLNQKHLGVLRKTEKGWRISGVPQGMTNKIADQVVDLLQ